MNSIFGITVKSSLKKAFLLTLPVLMGYLFLGITYGVLAHSLSYSVWYPLFMALFIYSGSVEFLGLGILLESFNPLSSTLVALVVGSRHVLYGISMLDRFKNTGAIKPFLIYLQSDETFAINYNAKNLTHIEMLFVSVLNYLYWVCGGLLGYFLGTFINVDICGLEFVVTAMFVAIFMDQFLKERERRPAYIGIICTALCLVFFGKDYFILFSIVSMVLLLLLFRKSLGIDSV